MKMFFLLVTSMIFLSEILNGSSERRRPYRHEPYARSLQQNQDLLQQVPLPSTTATPSSHFLSHGQNLMRVPSSVFYSQDQEFAHLLSQTVVVIPSEEYKRLKQSEVLLYNVMQEVKKLRQFAARLSLQAQERDSQVQFEIEQLNRQINEQLCVIASYKESSKMVGELVASCECFVRLAQKNHNK